MSPTPIPGVVYSWDAVAASWKAPGRASLDGDPVFSEYSRLTVAVVGGSNINETNLRAELVDRGYATEAVFIDAPSGKTLNNTDSNGRTALQSVARAIDNTAGCPDVWVIDLNSTDSAPTITSQVNALLGPVSPAWAKGRKLIWVGRTADASAFNATAEPLVEAKANATFAVWDGIGDRDAWLAGQIGNAISGNDGGWRPYQLQFTPPRPTGATYTDSESGTTYQLVRWEDLYVSGDSFQQVLNKITGGKVLTLPEGVFEFNDFNMGDPGFLWFGLILGQGGATGCKGIIGSGRGTIIRIKAHTSTKPQSLTNPTTGVNQLWQILVNKVDDCIMANFTLEGTDQSSPGAPAYYNGLKIARSNRTLVRWVWFRGAGPGYQNGPPGESMSIQVYYGTDSKVIDCEFDGRMPNGVRAVATNISFNGPIGCLAKRVYSHHTGFGHGMVSWLGANGVTEDYWAWAISTAGGGSLGCAVNHEQAKGTWTHNRPRWILDGKWSSLPTKTANPGMHYSAWSTTDDTVIVINDPIHDSGPDGAGLMSCDMREAYSGGGIAGAGFNVITTQPVVRKGGTALAQRTRTTTGVVAGDTPDTHHYVYTVTFWT